MVEGRKAKIWYGDPIPSSMPRATPRPSSVTVILDQVRARGGTLHCAVMRDGRGRLSAAKLMSLEIKVRVDRHGGVIDASETMRSILGTF